MVDLNYLKRNVFPGESGGDYDALFSYSNRPGKPFAGTRLTDMTVDQAIGFSNPSGPYGQWVKGQIGRVATPMGAYQIVGTTLRAAKQGLGLTGNEVMTPELQDRLGQWIYQAQGPGAWEAWGKGGGSTRKPAMVRGGAGQTSLLGQAGGDTLSPAAEPEKRRGLLGFLGDEDRRARLAIALEGMTLNPNTALVGALQEGIKGRREDKRINATAQWLKSRGRDDLAEIMLAGGLSPTDAVRSAMTPEPQAEPIKGVAVGGNLVNPITGEIIYQGGAEQGEVREVGGRLVRVNPDGSVQELFAPPQDTVSQKFGRELGLTGADADKLFNVDPSGKITAIGGGGTTVNVDAGQKGSEKFEEEFGKTDAKLASEVYASGLQAARNMARIDQLDQLLRTAPTGAEGAIKSIAGEFGIPTEGLSDIQAAQALINSLVPEQRQPGSGPMSDADLALFKQSLPRIINQPGGNQMIVSTMRAIAQYDAEGASIVQGFRDGAYDRADMFRLLRNRVNPLANFRAPAGAAGGTAPAAGGMPADFAQKYGEIARQNGVTIEQLWEAWPNK